MQHDDPQVSRRYFPGEQQRFLVTGSTGLLGSALTEMLLTAGHEVTRLVRPAGPSPTGGRSEMWEPARGRLEASAVSGYDVVVHLAGAGIADRRWTPDRKALIRSSRVDGTGLLARALAESPRPPRVLVSASAVGIYGDRGDEEVDEASEPGSGFLAETARAWEAATGPAVDAGIRVVHLRIGVVLTARGGALARMLPPFRAGLGGPLGNGRQFWSWVTLDDLLAAVLHAAATEDLAGPLNAVSPEPVRNSEFTEVLARVLNRPALFRVPAAALRLLLGEMGEELLLASTRVRPTRLLDTGFEYRFGTLERALEHVLGRSTERTP